MDELWLQDSRNRTWKFDGGHPGKTGLVLFCKKNGLSGMWCWEIDADRERWRRYMMQLARSSYVDKIAWNLPCMCIVCGDWRVRHCA